MLGIENGGALHWFLLVRICLDGGHLLEMLLPIFSGKLTPGIFYFGLGVDTWYICD